MAKVRLRVWSRGGDAGDEDDFEDIHDTLVSRFCFLLVVFPYEERAVVDVLVMEWDLFRTRCWCPSNVVTSSPLRHKSIYNHIFGPRTVASDGQRGLWVPHLHGLR